MAKTLHVPSPHLGRSGVTNEWIAVAIAIYANEQDITVPEARSRDLSDALRQCGWKARMYIAVRDTIADAPYRPRRPQQ